eukprot:1551463-Prymnesium_polylepis.1
MTPACASRDRTACGSERREASVALSCLALSPRSIASGRPLNRISHTIGQYARRSKVWMASCGCPSTARRSSPTAA